MSQTPVKFPIHGNAAAEHWAKEARNWHMKTRAALVVTALVMFAEQTFACSTVELSNSAANRAAESAKEARRSAEAAWWNMHSEQEPRTWPVPASWYDTKIMQCDAEKCEVR